MQSICNHYVIFIIVETREAAFIEALQVAAVTSLFHSECTNGNIRTCGCYAQQKNSSAESREPERLVAQSDIPDNLGGVIENCEDSLDVAQRFSQKYFEQSLKLKEDRATETVSRLSVHHNFRAGRLVKISRVSTSLFCFACFIESFPRQLKRRLPKCADAMGRLAPVCPQSVGPPSSLSDKPPPDSKTFTKELKRSALKHDLSEWVQLVQLLVFR